ncbi:SET domain-containing protein-lysine N-methyltransferase [Anabaena catenula]|uniref:SET domain-containing protein n=1 Tax=Anabaena catenula FACHB-362 TaxID=2692877 RepID=A0ABR8IXA5_9NOST|nr:SET domain-containing protein [Anabaena catenula]MBD2690677.1 SET domain-containing protein [Anabaena catenula FACHB-362]
MLCIKTEVRESNIANAGKGLFSLEFVPKGSIVFLPITLFPIDNIVSETQYREELKTKDYFPMNAGMRWAGDYFLYCSQEPHDADYINHADNPNLLSCLGLFFALQDINFGDELTIDYRYIGFTGGVEIKTDNQEEVIGLSAKEALLKSATTLINLLNEVDDIHCFDLPIQKLTDKE